jgi:hypothetical protein
LRNKPERMMASNVLLPRDRHGWKHRRLARSESTFAFPSTDCCSRNRFDHEGDRPGNRLPRRGGHGSEPDALSASRRPQADRGPDGTAIVPTSKPQPDGTLVEALARAWRWQRLLDESVCASISDIGDAENISKSYVSRILRLALLAPDIVEGILAGRADQSLMLERLERPLPMDWCEQGAFLSLSVRVHGPWVGS